MLLTLDDQILNMNHVSRVFIKPAGRRTVPSCCGVCLFDISSKDRERRPKAKGIYRRIASRLQGGMPSVYQRPCHSLAIKTPIVAVKDI